MTKLINIASDKTPFFIDPMSVTAVHISDTEKTIDISNEKGRLVYAKYEAFGIDPVTLMDALAAAGNKLAYFPCRLEPNVHQYYVSPAAVTYATLSTVNKKGTMGAIIGIMGISSIQSYESTPEEVKNLLDEVKATGKTMMEYAPDNMSSRWSNASALYIDPAAVTSIRDDGYQVNVYFMNSDLLDVQPQNDVTRPEQDTARIKFAAEVAAANGTLTHITGSKRAIYVKPEEFPSISFYDDEREGTKDDFKYRMTLQPQKTDGNPYFEKVSVFFNDAAARAASFKALTGVNPPAPAASPKP